MSWFDALVPKIKRRQRPEKSTMPEGLWQKCSSCGIAIYEGEMKKRLGVCRKCNHHHHLAPNQRANSIFDPDTDIQEIAGNLRSRDFLGFTDEVSYKERLRRYGKDEASSEALRTYLGFLGGRHAVIACFDWSFMGGSLGSVAGERFMRGIDMACDRGAPFIVFSASGGARMQEGLVSLMQMAKTTAAQAKLASFGLPFISVLCNPTTGGVAASFAMIGDIIIAEPGAMIGFAGERVIRATVREELPPGFQRAEFLLEHGSLDMVVPRMELRATIATLAGIMLDGRTGMEAA